MTYDLYLEDVDDPDYPAPAGVLSAVASQWVLALRKSAVPLRSLLVAGPYGPHDAREGSKEGRKEGAKFSG